MLIIIIPSLIYPIKPRYTYQQQIQNFNIRYVERSDFDMMENTTDRLFWTLTSVILGALLLTVSVKAFPNITNATIAPMSGFIKQADTMTKNSNKAANDQISNITESQAQKDAEKADAQAKANAVDQSQSTVSVQDNGDGTATVIGLSQSLANAEFSSQGQPSNLVIPEYVKVNNQPLKITAISDDAFNDSLDGVNTVTFPQSLTTIGVHHGYGGGTFRNAGLSEIYIPNTVTTILPGSLQFAGAHITAPKALQSQVIAASTLSQNSMTFY